MLTPQGKRQTVRESKIFALCGLTVSFPEVAGGNNQKFSGVLGQISMLVLLTVRKRENWRPAQLGSSAAQLRGAMSHRNRTAFLKHTR